MSAKGKIVVGITGGISVYKTVEVCSRLKKSGYEIKAVMTSSALEFVKPLTFETITENSVTTELFPEHKSNYDPQHISLSRWGDVFLICPATANIIGKLANGMADDFLSTMLLAVDKEVIFAPAMNTIMYKNPIVKENIEKLRTLGYEFISPEEGVLACGEKGTGRLPGPDKICAEVEKRFKNKGDNAKEYHLDSNLQGVNVLVTSGATRERIDPVRYITNPSSGKMGFAIARAFKKRGALVTLITAYSEVDPPLNLDKVIKVTNTEEMYRKVLDHFEEADIVIKTAAVSDFKPENYSKSKVKKEGKEKMVLELSPTPDILKSLGEKKGNKLLVGFAAETSNITENARDKLERKNLDLVVANDITSESAGFGKDVNTVKLVFSDGSVKELPTMKKDELGEEIAKTVESIFAR